MKISCNKTILLLICLLLISAVNSSAQKSLMTVYELKTGWEFKSTDSMNWMPAKVPGCVHTDLIANKIIENPFYRLNEQKVQWVENKDWEYQTSFWVSRKTLSKQRIMLDFKGLDTEADVFLNGIQILQADNMFREWFVNCKSRLKPGQNTLRILFHSPAKTGLMKHNNYPCVQHVTADSISKTRLVPSKVRIQLRKTQSAFGWDWGPRLVTSGIWLPVYLKAWNDARIVDLSITQNKLSDKEAKLTGNFEIESENNSIANLRILIGSIKENDKKVTLQKGIHTYKVDFLIKNPQRWWTNGLGKSFLYKITGEVEIAGHTETVTHHIGLRTLEIVQKKDQVGTSLYVKLNGNPVFMKGANYIPSDVFLDRVTPSKYKEIIKAAKECNFNMLRVWGGGNYEKDLFYDLCDQNGILIWQEFIFAGDMYPGDQNYLDNVKAEAEYNIKRLRNHPCIALWCGNNEILSAWKYWGLKGQADKVSKEAAGSQWKAYKDIFLDILPTAVKQFDPNRFYWASSPQAGDTVPEDYKSGDAHYWGVWWGKEPFANYQKKISRFMTEYGFQSFPEFKTVKTYTKPEDWNIYSEVMKFHQRSSIGNETIELYMLRDYRKPKDFESFLYTGQVLQAEGIKMAIEGHRMKMPYNMGSLFWQLNDVWPVASWSSIDYYGRWKALQYYSKKAFAPVLIAPIIQDSIFKVKIVSDLLKPINTQIKLKLMDLEGKVIWTKNISARIEPNSCQTFFEDKQKEFQDQRQNKNLIFVADILENNKTLSHNTFHFVPVKDLELPVPHISSKIKKEANGFSIQLTANKVAKNVYLSCDKIDGIFSDNFFDLIPGEVVTVKFKTGKSVNCSFFKNSLMIKSLRDTYN